MISNPSHKEPPLSVQFIAFFAISLLLLFSSNPTKAQLKDSLKTRQSSFSDTALVKKHPPKMAALMSAIVPGLGQAYNKKYWKVPLIYAGFAGLGYAFKIHQNKYNIYKQAYQYGIDKDSTTINPYKGIYSDANLKTLINSYHKYRDLFAITISALYMLNIVDASVDAHLFTFDVGDDLSLKVSPYISNIAYTPKTPVGLTLTCRFLK